MKKPNLTSVFEIASPVFLIINEIQSLHIAKKQVIKINRIKSVFDQ